MGNLVKPKGKPKNRQSFPNKIFELAKASPSNLILKTLPIFRLLWIWYSTEHRFKKDLNEMMYLILEQQHSQA